MLTIWNLDVPRCTRGKLLLRSSHNLLRTTRERLGWRDRLAQPRWSRQLPLCRGSFQVSFSDLRTRRHGRAGPGVALRRTRASRCRPGFRPAPSTAVVASALARRRRRPAGTERADRRTDARPLPHRFRSGRDGRYPGQAESPWETPSRESAFIRRIAALAFDASYPNNTSLPYSSATRVASIRLSTSTLTP